MKEEGGGTLSQTRRVFGPDINNQSWTCIFDGTIQEKPSIPRWHWAPPNGSTVVFCALCWVLGEWLIIMISIQLLNSSHCHYHHSFMKNNGDNNWWYELEQQLWHHWTNLVLAWSSLQYCQHLLDKENMATNYFRSYLILQRILLDLTATNIADEYFPLFAHQGFSVIQWSPKMLIYINAPIFTGNWLELSWVDTEILFATTIS